MPSQNVLKEKQEMVDKIAEKLKSATSVIAVDYKGINVSDDTALRAEMRANNLDYFVAKNSLLRYACEKSGFEEFVPSLVGTTALALSVDDALAPAKVVQKYSDKLRDIFNTKIGFVDGKFVDPAEIRAIALLPPKETLVAMVAGSLNGIIASLARAVAEVAKKLEEAA
ncbi:MAG: 50S ribosomal protein L10 [Oscillospiraceae bacterium]|nr:50S ribosomal protein L10 [Oscillospiraceae bacterium]